MNFLILSQRNSSYKIFLRIVQALVHFLRRVVAWKCINPGEAIKFGFNFNFHDPQRLDERRFATFSFGSRVFINAAIYIQRDARRDTPSQSVREKETRKKDELSMQAGVILLLQVATVLFATYSLHSEDLHSLDRLYSHTY